MPEETKKNTETQPTGASKMSIARMIALALVLILGGWMLLKSYLFKPEMYNANGETMGTAKYHVIVCAESGWGWERSAAAVESELARIDKMMSTFIADSEVSKFNDNPSTDWISVSPEIVELVKLSKEVSQTVDGKFDITIEPLIELWGFGKRKRTLVAPPAPADIAMTQLNTGLDKLEYQEKPPALKKAVPKLRIDLSGIAKGYAVDRVAAVLEKRGYTNYQIDIGGEIRVKGHKVVMQEKTGWFSMFASEKANVPWEIGIERPIPHATFEQPIVVQKFQLNDRALATSGDTYETHDIAGRRYTHIIDPISGEAVQSFEHGTDIPGEEIGSVSVIAPTCAEADALATGFFLLDVKRGIEIADADDLAVVYLIRTGESAHPVRAVMSEAYKKNYQ